MLTSSSGSSLMARSLKETGTCSSEAEEWPSWTALSSPARCCLSFLLFFFLSLSAFLRSSGCREGGECWWNKGGTRVRRSGGERTRLMMWLRCNSRLFYCDRRVGLLSADVSCSCPGGPWRGAGGRRLGSRGSNRRCQLYCLCCWEGWNCSAMESPGTA